MKYTFNPDKLHEISKRVIGTPVEGGELFNRLTQELATDYPKAIYTGPRKWILSNAGGVMGEMCLLYASLKEYLIIFGTPVGTGGHSGRYRADVWDFMLAGTMAGYVEGSTEGQQYKPGDAAFLGKNQAKGIMIQPNGWMLEYAQGSIPGMLPFALGDALFSTLDLATVKDTFLEYSKHMARAMRGASLGRWFKKK